MPFRKELHHSLVNLFGVAGTSKKNNEDERQQATET